MATVEELVDEIRRTFSPDEVLDLPKGAALSAKLRLLSYQLTPSASANRPSQRTKSKEQGDYSMDWYKVETSKFARKPSATQPALPSSSRRALSVQASIVMFQISNFSHMAESPSD